MERFDRAGSRKTSSQTKGAPAARSQIMNLVVVGWAKPPGAADGMMHCPSAPLPTR